MNSISSKKHSEETKKLLSEKRKAYLAANKDKHNWSRYSNKETVPERKFREFIERTDIKLKQYYIPPESDRFYEMDFAHPESKIAFEINGNQHYNSDGTLKDYYKERQQYFINLGWKITEIHYSLCFKEDVLSSLVQLSFSDFNLCQEKIQEISDHRLERKRQREEKILEKRNAKKLLAEYRKQNGIKLSRKKRAVYFIDKDVLSKLLFEKPIVEIAKDFNVSIKIIYRHIKHYNLERPKKSFWERNPTENIFNARAAKRKVERPSKEELQKMLWEIPTTHIAEKFGVSDTAIKKWAQGYGLEKPPRGYWEKLKSNKL